jgi:hypothetical protein
LYGFIVSGLKIGNSSIVFKLIPASLKRTQKSKTKELKTIHKTQLSIFSELTTYNESPQGKSGIIDAIIDL